MRLLVMALFGATTAAAAPATQAGSILAKTPPATCATQLPVTLRIENDDRPAATCREFERGATALAATSFAVTPDIELEVLALDRTASGVSCKARGVIVLPSGPVLAVRSAARVASPASQRTTSTGYARDCIEAIAHDLATRMATWLVTPGNVPTSNGPTQVPRVGPPTMGTAPWRSPLATVSVAALPTAAPAAGTSLLSTKSSRSCNATLRATVTAENDAPRRDVACRAFEAGAQSLKKAQISTPTIAIRVRSIVMSTNGVRCDVTLTEGSGDSSTILTSSGSTPIAPAGTADMAAQDCVWRVVEDLTRQMVGTLLLDAAT